MNDHDEEINESIRHIQAAADRMIASGRPPWICEEDMPEHLRNARYKVRSVKRPYRGPRLTSKYPNRMERRLRKTTLLMARAFPAGITAFPAPWVSLYDGQEFIDNVRSQVMRGIYEQGLEILK